MLQFQVMENTPPLEIYYSGERLDLYALGVFQLQMQDVVDKVTFGLLSQAGLIEPTWRRAKYLPRQPFPASDRFVRAEIRELGVGSLTEAVTFAVATVMADPPRDSGASESRGQRRMGNWSKWFTRYP